MVEDDVDNPWRWIGTAQVGQPSEILVSFGPLGVAKSDGVFFLNDNGKWYRIDPPMEIPIRPVAWRYATKKVE